MIQRSCQILTIFFLKKFKNRPKDTLERVIILTLDENYLMQGQGLILATFVESFVFDHWITLALRQSGKWV